MGQRAEQSSPGTGLGRGPQAVSSRARKRGGQPPEFQTSGSLTAHIVFPVLPETEAVGSRTPCPGHPFPCLGWLCGQLRKQQVKSGLCVGGPDLVMCLGVQGFEGLSWVTGILAPQQGQASRGTM